MFKVQGPKSKVQSESEVGWYVEGLLMAAILWILAIVIYLTVMILPAFGADYYVYKDRAGRTHLTNIPPPANISNVSNVSSVQKFEWEDVSWEAVREAEKRQELFWLGIKIEELSEKIEKLAQEVQRFNVQGSRPHDAPTFISGSATSIKVEPVIVVPKAGK